MKKTQISFTITKENHTGLTKIANQMGMSLSVFLMACTTQIRIYRGLPYTMKLLDKQPLTSDHDLD